MCCFEETLNNLFPTSWLDPYGGNTPFADNMELGAEICKEDLPDGIRVKSIKTPPRADTTKVADVIAQVLQSYCCCC